MILQLSRVRRVVRHKILERATLSDVRLACSFGFARVSNTFFGNELNLREEQILREHIDDLS